MDLILPEAYSTFADRIDGMYYVILWITGIIFVGVQAALVWFLIRYRHREGHRAEYIHGNVKAEIVWTAIPFFIVLGLAFASRSIWDDVKNPDRIPPDAYEIRVTAEQFEWNAAYSGADGEFGTTDDFSLRNRLVVPVGHPVGVRLESLDVIHSFFLPDMRVKQDVMPGMTNHAWFEVTAAGEYPLACAELCGLGHYRMEGTVDARSREEFDAWLGERSARATGTSGEAVTASAESAPPTAATAGTAERE